MMNFEKPLLLASASPRRKELMQRVGLPFKTVIKQVDESFPTDLRGAAVATYIAKKKAAAYEEEVLNGETVITADTIVVVDDMILGKPANRSEAIGMLQTLSGRTHQVITAVCIRSKDRNICFETKTEVQFRQLEEQEILYYVDQYKPFDKAGGYGIQEWIGHVGIVSIDGSYDNVVGLPVEALWQQLKELKKEGIL
ncbi:MAG: septum formation protein Maf [Bacteroidota bacterium]|jgi:septum formation protein